MGPRAAWFDRYLARSAVDHLAQKRPEIAREIVGLWWQHGTDKETVVLVFGDSGLRVRTKDERSAKLFLAEREMHAPRRELLPRTPLAWGFLITVLAAVVVVWVLSS